MTEQEVLELLDKFISTSFDLADDIRYAFNLSETEDDFINTLTRMHGNDFEELTK